MDFIGEVCGLLLFTGIKRAFVHTVGDHRTAQLAAGQLVQDQAFFAGVDHGAVIKFRVFLRQFGFICQSLERVQDLIVYLFGCILLGQTCRHGSTVFSDPFCPVFTGHCFLEVYMPFECTQFFECRDGIKVFPVHMSIPILFGSEIESGAVLTHT